MIFKQSAFKWGITESEIQEALADPDYIYFAIDENADDWIYEEGKANRSGSESR